MPIEIRELTIKANVDENNKTTASAQTAQVNTENIIASCVEQVLEILKQKNER